jgi:hypothetical protein
MALGLCQAAVAAVVLWGGVVGCLRGTPGCSLGARALPDGEAAADGEGARSEG